MAEHSVVGIETGEMDDHAPMFLRARDTSAHALPGTTSNPNLAPYIPGVSRIPRTLHDGLSTAETNPSSQGSRVARERVLIYAGSDEDETAESDATAIVDGANHRDYVELVFGSNFVDDLIVGGGTQDNMSAAELLGNSVLHSVSSSVSRLPVPISRRTPAEATRSRSRQSSNGPSPSYSYLGSSSRSRGGSERPRRGHARTNSHQRSRTADAQLLFDQYGDLALEEMSQVIPQSLSEHMQILSSDWGDVIYVPSVEVELPPLPNDTQPASMQTNDNDASPGQPTSIFRDIEEEIRLIHEQLEQDRARLLSNLQLLYNEATEGEDAETAQFAAELHEHIMSADGDGDMDGDNDHGQSDAHAIHDPDGNLEEQLAYLETLDRLTQQSIGNVAESLQHEIEMLNAWYHIAMQTPGRGNERSSDSSPPRAWTASPVMGRAYEEDLENNQEEEEESQADTAAVTVQNEEEEERGRERHAHRRRRSRSRSRSRHTSRRSDNNQDEQTDENHTPHLNDDEGPTFVVVSPESREYTPQTLFENNTLGIYEDDEDSGHWMGPSSTSHEDRHLPTTHAQSNRHDASTQRDVSSSRHRNNQRRQRTDRMEEDRGYIEHLRRVRQQEAEAAMHEALSRSNRDNVRERMTMEIYASMLDGHVDENAISGRFLDANGDSCDSLAQTFKRAVGWMQQSDEQGDVVVSFGPDGEGELDFLNADGNPCEPVRMHRNGDCDVVCRHRRDQRTANDSDATAFSNQDPTEHAVVEDDGDPEYVDVEDDQPYGDDYDDESDDEDDDDEYQSNSIYNANDLLLYAVMDSSQYRDYQRRRANPSRHAGGQRRDQHVKEAEVVPARRSGPNPRAVQVGR